MAGPRETAPIDHSNYPVYTPGSPPPTPGDYRDLAPPGILPDYYFNTLTTSPMSLSESVVRMGRERDAYKPYKTAALANLGTQASRQAKNIRRGASFRLAMDNLQGPGSYAGELEAATRRMRARQGIVNRGDEAIKNQQLKDRIATAQQHLSRRGSLQNALQTALNIQEGVNVGVSDANNRAKASQYAMYGSLAGSAVRIGQDYFDKRKTNTGSGGTFGGSDVEVPSDEVPPPGGGGTGWG